MSIINYYMTNNYEYEYIGETELILKLNDICRFDVELFKEGAYTEKFWRYIINNMQHAIIVHYNRIIVGLIITTNNKYVFGCRCSLCESCLSYIAWLGICETHRKNGIGSELLKCLENKLLPTLKKYNIILDVEKNNSYGIKFYNKRGYKMYGKDENRYVMVKKLIK